MPPKLSTREAVATLERAEILPIGVPMQHGRLETAMIAMLRSPGWTMVPTVLSDEPRGLVFHHRANRMTLGRPMMCNTTAGEIAWR